MISFEEVASHRRRILKNARPHSRTFRGAASVLFATVLAALLPAAFLPATALAAEIEGVEFPDEIKVSEDPAVPLKVFGTGLLRYRVVFRGYVAALYLPEGVPGERALDDVPRRLELSYFWSIDGEDFGEAANQLLARSLGERELEALKPKLERLHRAYRDVRPGDRYALTYVPDVGTELRLNDEQLVTIPGEDFARAYFGIWLGDEPLDEGLRDKLLRRG